MTSAENPTSLRLPRLSPSRIGEVRGKLNLANRINNQHSNALTSQIRLGEALQGNYDRLTIAVDEANKGQFEIRSSQVVGLMYLSMHEELYLQRGLSEDEFRDYFKMVVRLNEKVWEPFISTLTTKGLQAAQAADFLGSQREIETASKEEVGKLYGDSPAPWFKGSDSEWRTFLAFHTVSQYYLKPTEAELRGYPVHLVPPKDILPPELEAKNVPILADGHPDWYSDWNSGIMYLGVVRKEFDQDSEQDKSNRESIDSALKQKVYIAHNVNNKGKVAVKRFQGFVRDSFLPPAGLVPGDFENLLYYLSATYGHQITKLSSEELDNLSARDFGKTLIDAGPHQESVIEDFTKAGLFTEGVALYLERKFREAGLARTMSEPVGASQEPLLSLVDSVTDGDSLDHLRGSKRLHNVFNYELRPLLQTASGSSLDYLRELILISDGEPIEAVVWDMAEVIKNGVDLQDFDLKKPKAHIEKSLSEIVRVSRRWLSTNWRWAVNRMVETVNAAAKGETPQVVEPEDTTYEAEIEQEIKEAQEGLFSGWKLTYTDNETDNPRHIHEIGGRTIDERQAAFRKFLQSERISVPHPDSVMRALEWDVEKIPDHVRHLQMREIINGLEFKKIKRGAARIYHISDHEAKSMLFFAHRKYADKIRFTDSRLPTS